MFLKEVLFTYETIISLITIVVAVIGVYWKMRIDLAKLTILMDQNNNELRLKITEIICDREKKWNKYEEKQEKQDAYQSDILGGINDIRVKIAGMEKNIEWLKKN